MQTGDLFLLDQVLRHYVDVTVNWNGGLVLTLLLTAMVVSSLQLFLYTLVKEQGLSIITLAIFSIGMLLLSGGLIPAAFLPKEINAIGTYLPTNWMLQLQSAAVQGNGIGTLWAEQSGQITACLFTTLCFLAGAGAVQKYRTR